MRPLLRMGVAGAALAAGAFWYFNYFALPKRTYNGVHPYTSFIAIFVYLVLRNITPGLRRLHLHFFAWCGKITLETYILQFHIWMKTTGLNGSPKYLMVWLPGYYWTNFVLITAIYVFLSYRVFIITAALRDYAIPREGGAALAKRGGVVAAGLAALYGLASVVAPSLVPPPVV